MHNTDHRSAILPRAGLAMFGLLAALTLAACTQPEDTPGGESDRDASSLDARGADGFSDATFPDGRPRVDVTPDATDEDAPVPETCGDGVLDPAEACDGELLGGLTCADLGFAAGTLRCKANCVRDVSDCTQDPGPLCGDGVREGDEECDGDDLGDMTCGDFGFDEGTLACSDDCTLSTRDCDDAPECGDGVLDEGESCDDGNGEPGDGCFACVLETCGDGIVQASLGEICEPPASLVTTCEDGDAGIARCTDECDYGEPECPDAITCGDGVLDLGEECDDGNDVPDDGCDNCVSERCGDGTRQPGEACDGADVGDVRCEDFGFDVGTIACEECALDLRTCRSSVCGDGVVEGDESCDDGNTRPGDGCSGGCQLEGCPGEEIAPYWIDGDEDGFGDAEEPPAFACEPLEGYADNADDCDDDDPSISPDADEVCDGVDNDCDGTVDGTTARTGERCTTELSGVCADGRLACVDGALGCAQEMRASDELCDGLDNDCDGDIDEAADGGPLGRLCYSGPDGTEGVGVCTAGVQTCRDGVFGACVDERLPYDAEFCDRLDNDCDGEVDEDLETAARWPDRDGDGFGDADAEPIEACGVFDDLADNADDCDDGDDATSPEAVERCDGVDNDCDGEVDEAVERGGERCETGEPGVCAAGALTCLDGELACVRSAEPTDERCDGLDNDCDGATDEGADGDPLVRRCYDGPEGTDGVGVCASGVRRCEDGVLLACAEQIVPSDETCDSLDNDCDGEVDEEVVELTFYPDEDGDGFGAGEARTGCRVPDGFAENADDCNDAAAEIRPGADDTLNGIDDDCDGEVDEASPVADDDGDGFCEVGPCVGGLPDGDCDDDDPTRFPDAPETVDGQDDDCDGIVDDETERYDDDDDGFCEVGPCIGGGRPGDCDDANDATFPGAPEIDDGLDNDCNGVPDDERTWIGGAEGAPDDWSTPENWLPAGVPTSDEGVLVPAAAETTPALSATVSVGDVYVEEGAQIDLGAFDLTVNGDVVANGPIVGSETLFLRGTDVRMSGTLPNVSIETDATLGGETTVDGAVTVTRAGELRLGGHFLRVAGDLAVTLGRERLGIIMDEPDDELLVEGDASFTPQDTFGGSGRGALRSGMLRLHGDFAQQRAGNARRSFSPEGTLVVFEGTEPQVIEMQSPGPEDSWFDDVEVRNDAGVTLATNTLFRGKLSLHDGGFINGTDASYDGEFPQDGPDYRVERTHLVADRAIVEERLDVATLVVDAGVGVDLVSPRFELTGALEVNGTLRCRENTFAVLGDLTATPGIVDIGTGALEVAGVVAVGPDSGQVVVNEGQLVVDGPVTVTLGNETPSGLIMTEPAGRAVIAGDLTFTTTDFGSPSAAGNLTAGQLRLAGDLVQTVARFGSGTALQAQGTELVLDGEESQSVSFRNPGLGGSFLHDLTIDNPAGVVLDSAVWVTGDLRVVQGTLEGPRVFVTTALPEAAGYAVAETHIAADLVFDEPARHALPWVIVDSGVTVEVSATPFAFENDLTIQGELVAAGSELEVVGTTSIEEGELRGTGGTIVLAGDARVSGGLGTLRVASSRVEIGGNLSIQRARDIPRGLVMTDAEGELVVEGNASFTEENFTTGSTSPVLTAGTIRLRGDFTQRGATGSSNENFAPDGVRVIFDGTSPQDVAFGGPGAGRSLFDDVELENPSGVSFNSDVWVSGTLSMAEGATLTGSEAYFTTTLPIENAGYSVANTHVARDHTLAERTTLSVPRLVVDSGVRLAVDVDTFTLDGSLRVNGDVALQGNQLVVARDVEIRDGVVALEAGTLDVGRSVSLTADGAELNLGGGSVSIDENLTVRVGATYRGVKMLQPDDTVTVGGDVVFDQTNFSEATTEGTLVDGFLHVGGDFAQRGGIGAVQLSFVSTGTLVVFDGGTTQSVSLANAGATLSHFHDVRVENTAGVRMTPSIYAMGDLDILGSLTTTREVTVEGLLAVRADASYAAQQEVSYGTCLVEPGATVTGSGFVCGE